MPHYPINLDLKNRRCIVIGGGEVAERKIETLLEFDAAVFVIAPELTSRLECHAEQGLIESVHGMYSPEMLDGALLVFAATDDREVNRAVSEECRKRGILVNVADDPELCTFFVPAMVRRGGFVIGISTSGRSPALAKRVRESLETEFGPVYGDLADLMGELRDEVKSEYVDQADRNRAFVRILNSNVLDLLAQGERDEAMEKARECI